MSLTLDTTGTVSSNYVTDEVLIPTTIAAFPYIFLPNSPFFGKNLVVSYLPADGGVSYTLTLGVDYGVAFRMPGVGYDINTQLWGAIKLFDTTKAGNLMVQYQSLGGNWTFDEIGIEKYMRSNFFNPNQAYRALVPAQTLYYPSAPTITVPLLNANMIAQAQENLASIPLTVQYLELPPAAVNPTGTLRTPSVTVLAASSSGLTQVGAISVKIFNTSSSVAMTVGGAPLAAGQAIEFNAYGGDSIDSIAWSVPSGGAGLLVQLI